MKVFDQLLTTPTRTRDQLILNLLYLYRSSSLTTHWCTFLAAYEFLESETLHDILQPATEIVMFFDHAQTEDIRWLCKISGHLEFKEKTHVCTSLPDIELRDLSPHVQLIIASLKNAQERKILPMGCFLTREDLKDHGALLHHTKLWMAAPTTSEYDQCFCAVFEARQGIHPLDVAQQLNTVMAHEGYPSSSLGCAYSSIVVLFLAPASFRWLHTYQFDKLKQKFSDRGLVLKSVSPTTRPRLVELMKMKVNEPFKHSLFHLFCRLEPYNKACAPLVPPTDEEKIITKANLEDKSTHV